MKLPNAWSRSRRFSYLKRLLDIVFATFAMILLAPAILTVAFAVLAKLGQPVLFVQERPGRYGRAFRLIKFRTMLNSTDQRGRLLDDSERLTAFGKWLRSTSLDELPELWNVLKGDMSLVGPRPLLMKYLPLYTDVQMRRHEMRPGITGWAQVNGRNAISWEEKFALDVWYVDNASLLLDFRILLITLAKVFNRTGVTAEGAATMPEFQGDVMKRPQQEGGE